RYRRPPRTGHAAPRRGAGGREHARLPLDPPGRRRPRPQRQMGRHHEHGRGGPPDPGRRDDLRGAARGDPHRRRGDADRGGLASVRAPDHRCVRDAAGLVRRGDVGRRSRRRALLADPAPRRLRPRHGQLVRRHPELRRRRGLADQERVVPAGVPDGAVGPPRHRRLGLFPQDDRLGPAWGDGRDPRDARRAGAGGGEGLSPLIVGLAVGGAIFGALADRLAVRWPEHDEEHPAGRAVGWRTVATAAIGAFGFADVKLLVGVGLMTGLTRTVAGLLAGLLAAGLVLAALLATRRIGRRTYVPFGPFLIFGALWSIFVNG